MFPCQNELPTFGVFPISPYPPSLPASEERAVEVGSLSLSARLAYAGLGIGLFALLGTAACLEPAATGFGTHRQLGLPACTWMELWGMRCPSCGMTTSWSLALRGDWYAAARANPAGLLLFVQAICTAPCWLWIGIRGCHLKTNGFAFASLALLVTAFFLAILDWIAKIAS
ncbi:DUF2752 domain-containing protein [Pirellulaceae bacterium SH501]